MQEKVLTDKMINDTIVKIVKGYLYTEDVTDEIKEVDINTPLVDLGLDDLDTVELIIEIEAFCHIEITDEDIQKVELDNMPISELTKFVIKKVQEINE